MKKILKFFLVILLLYLIFLGCNFINKNTTIKKNNKNKIVEKFDENINTGESLLSMQNELLDILDNKISKSELEQLLFDNFNLKLVDNQNSYYNKLFENDNYLINYQDKNEYYNSLKNNFGRDNIDYNDESIIINFLLSYNPNFLLKKKTNNLNSKKFSLKYLIKKKRY